MRRNTNLSHHHHSHHQLRMNPERNIFSSDYGDDAGDDADDDDDEEDVTRTSQRPAGS